MSSRPSIVLTSSTHAHKTILLVSLHHYHILLSSLFSLCLCTAITSSCPHVSPSFHPCVFQSLCPSVSRPANPSVSLSSGPSPLFPSTLLPPHPSAPPPPSLYPSSPHPSAPSPHTPHPSAPGRNIFTSSYGRSRSELIFVNIFVYLSDVAKLPSQEVTPG